MQELAHHIAHGAADADAGPVGAALQHRDRRADRIGANDAVARAGAGAQAHAIAVVAGDVSGAFAGNGTAHAQVIAVHIADTAVGRLNLVPAAAGTDDLHLGASVITGDGGCVKIGGGAQSEPAADDGGIGRRHGGRRQDAHQHYRDQKNRKETFHLLIPPIFRLPGVVTIIIRTKRTKSSLLWNFIVQLFAKVVNSDIWWFSWVSGHKPPRRDRRCYKICKITKTGRGRSAFFLCTCYAFWVKLVWQRLQVTVTTPVPRGRRNHALQLGQRKYLYFLRF